MTADPDMDRRILEDRARELARPLPELRRGRVLTAVGFALGQERYAIETEFVTEVRKLADLTPLPGAPDHAVGLVNVRGEILVVFDLRPLLGLPAACSTGVARVIVVGKDRAELGVVADRADEVFALPADEVFPPAGGDPGLVRGLTQDGLAVLDGAGLLADPRFVVETSRQ